MLDGLVFDDVSHRFGSHQALRGVTFSCGFDAVTCLVGPNGAGKSTALGLASGLLKSRSGKILVGGVPVDGLAARRATGFLPQRSAYPDVLRVEEVLEFSSAVRGVDRSQCEALFAVTGLEAVLDRRIGELSGGWARRLGIHVALLPTTTAILLDEPFVGLDPDTLDALVAHLRSLPGAGVSVVISSHDFDVIDALMPKLVVLADGDLVGVVKPDADGARATYRRLLAERGAS